MALYYRTRMFKTVILAIIASLLPVFVSQSNADLVSVRDLMPPESNMVSSDSDKKKPFGFLFAHGLGGSAQQVVYYTQQLGTWHIIPTEAKTFNFPELLQNGAIDIGKVNFAQKADLDALDAAYQAMCKDCERIVLVGVSRGGSAVLKYAARRPSNLAAVIVEAAFDSIPNLIADYGLSKVLKSITAVLSRPLSPPPQRHPDAQQYRSLDLHVGSIPGLTSVVHNAFGWYYPGYDKKGSQVIDEIITVDRAIPILFVHSKQDDIVPLSCTYRLCKQLRMLGHNHAYLLELSVGQHAMYSTGENGWKYQATVHAFYQKYGIPHDDALAKQGNHFLQQAQRAYYDLLIYDDEPWDLES